MRPICVPLLLAALTAGCATYRIAIEPPPVDLPTRDASQRVPLTITVQSTYAPYLDGDLSTTDRYPRDSKLGQQDLHRYRLALLATQQFEAVAAGDPGQGLHCALNVVSGREPARTGRLLLSILLTFGQLSHEQREIVRIEAVVSRPGREPSKYHLEGRITTDAVLDSAHTRRANSLCGPENELARALVSQMAVDGWLDAMGARP
ncbi:MAG: hypothetical protein MUC36_22460 [Planctomycetes bacterium]|jgi:hypothetical protein|nr:hypothetical protein [Planctomycetota bacterium]